MYFVSFLSLITHNCCVIGTGTGRGTNLVVAVTTVIDTRTRDAVEAGAEAGDENPKTGNAILPSL